MLREYDKDPFGPKRKSFATGGISRIHDECHIKLSFPDSRYVIRRCTFQNLNANLWVAGTIDFYQVTKITGAY